MLFMHFTFVTHCIQVFEAQYGLFTLVTTKQHHHHFFLNSLNGWEMSDNPTLFHTRLSQVELPCLKMDEIVAWKWWDHVYP